MASLTTVNNGDTGLVARTAINANDVALNADIATLNAAIVTCDLVTGQAASFTKVLSALTKLESVDFLQTAGTPSVSIGTTPGGTELASLQAVASGIPRNVFLSKTFEPSTTIYITISGGTVSVEFYYRINRFTP